LSESNATSFFRFLMDSDADDFKRADSERVFRFFCVLRGVVVVTAAAD